VKHGKFGSLWLKTIFVTVVVPLGKRWCSRVVL
jgi:hypothetical protein